MGSHNTQTNDRGDWVPAIPVPFYGLRKRCGCGRKFWTMGGYRGHYALVHVMHVDTAEGRARNAG